MDDRLLIAILAAGASRRLGQPKQLVSVNGEPLLRRQCRIAIEADIAPVAVILGCRAEECAATLTELPVTIRLNSEWDEGIASSLREAARAAVERSASGLLILQADQFQITAQDLQAIYAAWRESGETKACRARHDDYAGPPVILPSACFAAVQQLQGDQGARSVLSSLGTQAVVEVAMPNATHDLDSPDQLRAVSDSIGG